MEDIAIPFFAGKYTHTLDAKGRVTIPSKWRIQGGENTYLALPNPNGYIDVYPPKMVARLEEIVASIKLSDHEKQTKAMELFSQADSFGCDKQGRINLGESLRAHAGIGGKAVFTGSLRHFSIWSEERYDERESSKPLNVFDAMSELGL
ncbi:MAG: mraZ [Opitutae bacterium]|nr:mraZ [Opitutae bacterium]